MVGIDYDFIMLNNSYTMNLLVMFLSGFTFLILLALNQPVFSVICILTLFYSIYSAKVSLGLMRKMRGFWFKMSMNINGDLGKEIVSAVQGTLQQIYNALTYSGCKACASNVQCVLNNGMQKCSFISPLFLFLVVTFSALLLVLYFTWKRTIRQYEWKNIRI